MLEVFSFNNINLVIIERAKAIGLLSALVLAI